MNVLNKNGDFKLSKINMILLRTLQWRAVQNYFDTRINLIPSTNFQLKWNAFQIWLYFLCTLRMSHQKYIHYPMKEKTLQNNSKIM